MNQFVFPSVTKEQAMEVFPGTYVMADDDAKNAVGNYNFKMHENVCCNINSNTLDTTSVWIMGHLCIVGQVAFCACNVFERFE